MLRLGQSYNLLLLLQVKFVNGIVIGAVIFDNFCVNDMLEFFLFSFSKGILIQLFSLLLILFGIGFELGKNILLKRRFTNGQVSCKTIEDAKI